jgi:hypothetical protein
MIEEGEDQSIEVCRKLEISQSLLLASAIMADMSRCLLFQEIMAKCQPSFRHLHFREKTAGINQGRCGSQGIVRGGDAKR